MFQQVELSELTGAKPGYTSFLLTLHDPPANSAVYKTSKVLFLATLQMTELG